MSFVELPSELQASLIGLVVSIVSIAFTLLVARVPFLSFLKKYLPEWSLAIGAAFVAWLQNVLPTGYEDVSVKGVSFAIALILAFIPYLVANRAMKVKGLL